MNRRVALLVSASVLAPILVAACGDSGSTPDTSTDMTTEVPVVAQTFELSADRLDGSTILANDDDTVKVDVPDVALPTGFDPNDITATVDQLVATDVGSGIEFALGPDGTEFSEPVTLTFVADWDPEGNVAVTAIADDGTNLLPEPEDADEVLKTLQVVPNDDGTSTISVQIDHFSRWSFINYGGVIPAITSDSGFLVGVDSGVDGRELYVIAGVLNSGLADLKVSRPLLCATMVNLRFRGATSDRTAASQGRRCEDGVDPAIEFWFPFECTEPGGGATGLIEVQYGLAGLDPFVLLIVLAGGEVLDIANSARRSEFWANASDALLFMRAPFSQDLYCTLPLDTTTSSTVAAAEVTTTTSPTTTSRGTVSRPTPPTPPGPGPTPPTPPTTTAATTTTIKATTTTKPRQGATTTLPRPSTGGTTTLP